MPHSIAAPSCRAPYSPRRRFGVPAALSSLIALLAGAPAHALTGTQITTNQNYVAPNVYNYTAYDLVDVGTSSATGSLQITQTGGTVNAKSWRMSQGVIDYAMSGGALNASVALRVPTQAPIASTVTFRQAAGTVTVGELHLSPYFSSSGAYTLSGGDLIAGGVWLGDAPATQRNCTSTLTLNGGTLTTSQIVIDEATGGARDSTSNLYFNGGTLRAGDTDNPAWINYVPYGGQGNRALFAVQDGGLILDTNSRWMGIPVPLSAWSANGGITKRGFGVVTLGGYNTYAGPTVIEAGSIDISDANNLGSPGNRFLLRGGSLRVSGTTLANLDSRTVDPVFHGALDVADAGHVFTLSQSLGSNNGESFTKTGPGTLVLTGQNAWSGGTSASNGKLVLAGPTDPSGAVGTVRGALTIIGGTVEAATANAVGYGNGTKVDRIVIAGGGRLFNNSNGAFGWGVAYSLSGALMQSNGGVADPEAPSMFTFGGPFAANTSVRVTPPGTSTIAGHIDLQGPALFLTNVMITVLSNATLNVTAAISSHNADAGFTKLGPGLMALQAANTFTSDTLLNEGTLAIDHPDALAFSRIIAQGGTLAFRGIDHATVGGLSGPTGVLLQNTDGGAVALTVSPRPGNLSNQGGALTGTGSLTKAGDGLFTLMGDSTYSGTTAVDAGTLYVDGTTGTGAVGVAAGATLSGLGRVIGAATVQAGGHVAPGSIVVQGERRAPLTFPAGLRLENGAVLDLELGAASDSVRVSGGTFSTGGGVVINAVATAGYAPGTYTLIDYTGAAANGVDVSQFTLASAPSQYHNFLNVQGSKLILTVSTAPATVTGTTVPAAGAYNTGKALDFTVHYDRAVTVTGTPRIGLTLNTGAVFANYVSGSGSPDLVFRYTIAAGNTDPDGIALATVIDANGGTLRDSGGSDADLTLNGTPSTAGILVDTKAPSATAIRLVGAPPSDSRTLSYTVTFSEPVTGVDAADFFIETLDGTATGTIGAVSGSGADYGVAINRVGGIGRLALSLRAAGSGIADAAGNAIVNGLRTTDPFQANLVRRCHVRQAAAGANDGTSWANAYNDLQFAVGDAGCTEIWVARGVYKPGIVKNAAFQPKAGASLFGGFAGTETALAQRTPAVIAANATVLSGDIDNNDTVDASGVVLDAATQIAGTNSATVILMPSQLAPGSNDATLLDGFIVTASDGNGALRCDVPTTAYTCAFTVNNVIFSGNRGVSGAAVSLSSAGGTSDPQFTKILFRGNRGTNSGGAVTLNASPGATLRPAFANVVFSGNTAFNWGGALDLNTNAGTLTPTFDNVTFVGNSSDVSRGAIAAEGYGGGTARVALRNAILWDGVTPEIIFAGGGGSATLDTSLVQGGCPAGATCANLVAGDPLLGALGDHGGALPTPSVGAGSAALDAGTCNLADDVRGFARPQGAGCDIGAVEARRSVLTVNVVGSGDVSAGALPAPLAGNIANCTGTCTATYDGEAQSMVTLTATPDAQSAFAGWSGDCTGTAAATTVATDAPRTCTATFVANATATTVALAAGNNPSTYGDALTFTATVAPQGLATVTPTGSVAFYDGVTLLDTRPLAGDGTATLTTTALTAGAHAIAAHYTGDSRYAAAAQPPSAPLGHVVQAIQPAITWSAPAGIVYGTALGATQLDAVALANGVPVVGTYTYTPPAGTMLRAGPAQPLSVTFVPADTTNFLTATAGVAIDVGRAPLTVVGTVVQNKPYDGNATATLTGGTLAGVIGADSVALAEAGQFVQANAGNGIAVIANDALVGVDANQYTLAQPDNLAGNITPATLTWHATPTTIAWGTAPGALTGIIDGFVNGESQASATTGTAAWTTPATAASPAGRYAIDGGGLTANFGNYRFVQDAANATALTIGATATTTTLEATLFPVWGQPVVLTATVALPEGSTGTPAGTVRFSEDGAPLTGCSGDVTVASGTATCTTSTLAVGIHQVVATFTPTDGNTSGSAAQAQVAVIVASTLTVVLNPQPWTSTLGNPVPADVSVTVVAPGGGVPTGIVTLNDGSTSCIATLSGGTGNCALMPTSAGTKTVDVLYTPDAASKTNYAVSGRLVSLTVLPAQPGATLVSSANPSVFGQPVTLTATVTPASGGVVPTGKAHFSIDAAAICTGAVLAPTGVANAASATCTIPQGNLAVGNHAVQLSYDGDPNNLASTQSLTQAVTVAPTTTTITPPASVVLGNTATIAVSVAANAPGSGTPPGSVTVNLGTATCTATLDASGAGNCALTPTAPAGTRTVSAAYAGSTNYAASNGTANLTIAKAATTTTLVAPGNITLGNPVSVTATVAANAPGAGTPTGTLAISDGGATAGDRCTITLPATQCTLTPSSAGTKTLSAVYTPDVASDVNFTGSSATAVTFVVLPAQAGTTLTSSANPSRYGDAVTFTAAITPAAGGVMPTGTVNFTDGSVTLCGNVALVAGVNSATAICNLSTLGVGSHAVAVTYPGDANNQPSNASVTQAVDKADQVLTFPAQTTPTHVFAAGGTFDIAPLATSATPNSGQAITYSALTAACSVSGTTVTMLATGTCTLAAEQAGDASYNAATRVTQSVGIGTAASTVTLAASTTTPRVGADVTLTATVSGESPTGTVTFLDGATVLCDRVALTTGGVATCTTGFATAGSRAITASYAGDANNAAQTSAPLAIDVQRVCTATTLAAAPDHVIANQRITLTATVAGTGQGCAEPPPAREAAVTAIAGSAPSGSVTFREGAQTLGTAALGIDGIAALPVSTLRAGTHTLVAEYPGDATFAPSQAQVTVVVGQPSAPQLIPVLDRWMLALLAGLLGGVAVMARRSRTG